MSDGTSFLCRHHSMKMMMIIVKDWNAMFSIFMIFYLSIYIFIDIFIVMKKKKFSFFIFFGGRAIGRENNKWRKNTNHQKWNGRISHFWVFFFCRHRRLPQMIFFCFSWMIYQTTKNKHKNATCSPSWNLHDSIASLIFLFFHHRRHP